MEQTIDVKTLRENLGMSQAALGAAVGVDQSTVSNWENGKPPRGPARKLLEALAIRKADERGIRGVSLEALASAVSVEVAE